MTLRKDEEHIRKSDEMLIALNTKFNDFIDNYKSTERERIDWRVKFEEKIALIEGNVRTLTIPFKITIWLFTIVGGAFLVEFSKRLLEFIKIHFHFH